MKNLIKVALLSSVITAALVYVVLEWRPLQSTTPVEPPAVSWASGPAPAPVPAAEDPATSADERNNIDVYHRLSPGVVNITTTTFGYDFFLRAIPLESGTGSGAIIDQQGHIVTNFHVIEGARNLEVTLADKSKVRATVVGFDANNDLAVLKIQTSSALTPIPLGTSAGLQVGQKVLAIGNPYGLERTLTTGIISSLGRSIQAPNSRIIEGVIQTDAAINPGNSGGPLLNSRGEMIGINTAIYSESGGSVGIGFAIPADTVRRIVGDLISIGYVRHPYLGIVQGFALSDYPGLARALRMGTSDVGIMVLQIQPGSPAERAGIREAQREVIVGNFRVPADGDVIMAVGGRTMNSRDDLATAIERYKPGDRVSIRILRNGAEIEVPVVLSEAPRQGR
jgi:putative serine protease PepD